MREGEVLLSKISQKYVVSMFTITKCNAMQLWDAVGGGGEGGLKVVRLILELCKDALELDSPVRKMFIYIFLLLLEGARMVWS